MKLADEEVIEQLKNKSAKKPKPAQEDEPGNDGQAGDPPNKGTLLMDASVAPQDIKYSTDLNLLNDSRQKSEELIDKLWAIQSKQGTKPRTYRRKARQAYLAVARKRKKSKKLIRRGIKKQFNYLACNFDHIDKLMDEVGLRFLDFAELRDYWVIQEVYRQQKLMYETKSNQCSDRIVSIHQPYVRAIVRGKDRIKVEFGAQIGVALFEGIASVDRISWDAYHEGTDLESHVENYRKRYGYYIPSQF